MSRRNRAFHRRALPVATMLLGAAILPAQAGTITITNPRSNGVSLPFLLTCTYPDGSESDTGNYTIRAGQTTEFTESGCSNFNIWFDDSRNRTFSYGLKAGRTYEFEWENNSHWDLVRD